MNAEFPLLRGLLDRAGADIAAARQVHDERLQQAARGDRTPSEALALLVAVARQGASRHMGQFYSADLERLLAALPAEVPTSIGLPTPSAPGSRRRVLHVCTQVYAIGGHTRAVQHWIRSDRDSLHSVVLLDQGDEPVPQPLIDTVKRFGGQLEQLKSGSIVELARSLRALARSADLVVLHIHPFDVIPVLAFANMPNRPPIALFNHADHLFGVGVSIVDTVIDIRPAGLQISLTRRGIGEAHSLLLPLPMKPIRRLHSRNDAKTKLGMDPQAIVLLSIGSDYKYRPLGELDFVEAHRTILDEFPECVLIVVGPSPNRYWQSWESETGGRVRPVAATTDLTPYLEAADIYLDALPFGSLTALLEAVLFATPAVSWGAFPADLGASVLRSNDVALETVAFSFPQHGAYVARIADLIRSAELRNHTGTEIARLVGAAHTQDAWLQQLRQVYAGAIAARRMPPSAPADIGQPGGLDLAVATLQAGQRNVASP